MLRLHERTLHVQKADAELWSMVLKFAQEKDLTDIELLQSLTGMQASTLKYMLRAERHPEDPSQKADEA